MPRYYFRTTPRDSAEMSAKAISSVLGKTVNFSRIRLNRPRSIGINAGREAHGYWNGVKCHFAYALRIQNFSNVYCSRMQGANSDPCPNGDHTCAAEFNEEVRTRLVCYLYIHTYRTMKLQNKSEWHSVLAVVNEQGCRTQLTTYC